MMTVIIGRNRTSDWNALRQTFTAVPQKAGQPGTGLSQIQGALTRLEEAVYRSNQREQF